MTAITAAEPDPVALDEVTGDSATWIELRTMSRGNWTWLVDLPEGARVLELAAPGSPLPGALALARATTLRQPFPAALPLGRAEGSLDCVVVHDALARLTAGDGSMLAECARVLRPGGWLYVSGENPLAFPALRADPRGWVNTLRRRVVDGARGSLARAARAAGFAEVRRLYAWPAIDAPRMLIPATRAACAAHERLERKHSNRGAARARLAQLGLHALLHPAEVVLCRR